MLDTCIGGLFDAGIEAEVQQFDSLDDLQEALDSAGPVIAALRHPGGGAHAVVVCDVAEDCVTVMDPAVGDYVAIPTAHFQASWWFLQNEGVLIGFAAGQPR